jgi:hypothetical protein
MRLFLRRAKVVMGQAADLGHQAFRSRQRSVRRLVRQRHRLARRQGETATAELPQAYGRWPGKRRPMRCGSVPCCEVAGWSARRLSRAT